MIVLDNVSKCYDAGSTYLVRDVSLKVPTDSLLVLLGGSGILSERPCREQTGVSTSTSFRPRAPLRGC